MSFCKRFKKKLFFIMIAVFAVTSCAPMIDSRGNFPEEKKISEIIPGKTKSFEVEYYLGSPSSKSVFGEEVWYYISSKQKRFAFYKVEELERKILKISFDEDGVVYKVEYNDLNDAVDVKIAGKETKTYGHSMGLLEQLIGNLGRFEESAE